MLSSAKIGTSSWRYYTDGVACAATEYYLGVGEAPGRWHGRGLDELGLVLGGRVDERQLEALFARGLHPGTGDRLGRAWRADAVTGFDLTFSAPKSVSALWALGDTDVAVAAMGAHRAAVEAGLAYLDTHAGLSRRGTDGVEQVQTAGLAVALFDHRTSRAGDPQLHTHALVINKVRCADGTWRTLDATELFHHKKSAGMIYQAALRNEMRQRLGVAFGEGNEHGQAEIFGVPEKLLSLWSKRTTQIDNEAEPKIAEYEQLLGRTLTAAERVNVVKTAVLKTRPGKEHPELRALHGHWTAEATQAGWSSEQLLAAVRAAAVRVRVAPAVPEGAVTGRPPAQTLAQTLDETLAQTLAPAAGSDRGAPAATAGARPVAGLEPGAAQDVALGFAAVRAAGQRRAVFSRADVAGQVAAHLPTSGLTAVQVVAEVERLTALAVGLSETVSVGDHPHGVTPRRSDARYAAREVLSAEARILSLADRGRRGGYGRVPLNELIPHARTLGLDPGQYKAVLELAGTGDFLSVLTAPAGAGKTRTLGAAAAAWQQAGYRVVGLAPSARAAAELADATGGQTDTLAKWLHMRDRYASLPVGSKDWARCGLNDRIVVLVDEASMANTLDLDRLTTFAAERAAKVVLVGDPAQIGVINGPGGMLAALAHTGHASTLEQIHRFTHPWERTASLALRNGDRTVLPVYELEGRLHPCPDSESALDGVFTHWSHARAEGQDALMLARTRVDVDALNARARTAAVASGQITGPAVTAGDRVWQAGDLLRTRRNNRQLAFGDSHVRNGDRFRVLGPGPGTAQAGEQGLIVEDLTGRGRLVLPAAYVAQHCEYGWASTIDSAQGATADLGLVLVRPGMDREHLYVAMTRGRLGNHAYVTPDATCNDDDHHHVTPHAQHVTSRATPSVTPRAEYPAADGLWREPREAQGPDDLAGDLPGGNFGSHASTPEQHTRQVLEAALATSGAQDAAHTALATARAAAVAATRRDADRHAAQDAADRARQSEAARTPTPEHTADLRALRQLQHQRDQLDSQHRDVARATEHARTELAGAPRWARARRRDLTHTLTACASQLQQHPEQLDQLNTRISQVTTRLDQHDRDWNARRDADHRTPRWPTAVPDPLGQLTRPTPSRSKGIPGAPRPTPSIQHSYPTTEPYRAAPDRAHGRSR